MKINFWKMHGASNDFILVDDRKETFPAKDKKWLAAISNRKTGIGCEGIILIQKSKIADFRMRFFNPDGGEADMCGNGARCIAMLAYNIGAAKSRMRIQTAAGILSAEILKGLVKIWMTEPKDWRLNAKLDIGGKKTAYGFVNTGVPHAVIPVKSLADCDVADLGAKVRYHRDFAPRGTNANFIAATGAHSIEVRTYERGVEAETLACGTGITASALVANKLGLVKPPVKVKAASGDVLTIDFKPTAEGAADVTMLGPAVHVFTGILVYN